MAKSVGGGGEVEGFGGFFGWVCLENIFVVYFYVQGPRCIKLTINGNFAFIGSFHRILDADWLWCLVAMVVIIEIKVIINGKFYATEPRFQIFNFVIVFFVIYLICFLCTSSTILEYFRI